MPGNHKSLSKKCTRVGSLSGGGTPASHASTRSRRRLAGSRTDCTSIDAAKTTNEMQRRSEEGVHEGTKCHSGYKSIDLDRSPSCSTNSSISSKRSRSASDSNYPFVAITPITDLITSPATTRPPISTSTELPEQKTLTTEQITSPTKLVKLALQRDNSSANTTGELGTTTSNKLANNTTLL